MSAVNLHVAVAELNEYRSQRTVGESNGDLFKVGKGIGSTNWHSHDEDEQFIVLKGSLTVHQRDGDVVLNEGDLHVVPRSVEHCPHADQEVHLLLVGRSVTSNEAGGKPAWSVGRPVEHRPPALSATSRLSGLPTRSPQLDGGSGSKR